MSYRKRRTLFLFFVFFLSSPALLYAQLQREAMLEKKQPDKKKIEFVLQEKTQKLLSLSGVVGTAQGACKGEPCIVVFVDQETPELRDQIPSEICGYPVVIQKIGNIEKRKPDEIKGFPK